jgi:hypothetical protein
MAEQDAKLPTGWLIEMDSTYFGAPKPGKRGRGATGKAKVGVGMETLTPSLPPCGWCLSQQQRDSTLGTGRLASEAVIKTEVSQGSIFLGANWILHACLYLTTITSTELRT